ncbi:MAG: hypothetical protein WD423_10615 [Rhodothermales bacterium]
MRRLAATLRRDVILQNRYRFYAVSLLMVLVWGGLLKFVLRTGWVDDDVVVPAFVLVNLIVTTFYFMGALVLLERSEGMLAALVVTPLRDLEYLTSKIVTLSMLGLVESLLIVILLFGLPSHLLVLITGTLFLGALYVLAGFISVVGHDSINEWIMPSAVTVAVLILPLVAHFGMVGEGVTWLHPLEPAMVLLRAAYSGSSVPDVAYGIGGSIVWTGLGLVWARRRFKWFAVRSAQER